MRRKGQSASARASAGQGTSELLDVVNLVTQAVWADLRRSNNSIELSQWLTMRRIGPARAP